MGCAKVKTSVFKRGVGSFQKVFFVYLIFVMFVFPVFIPVVFGGPHADYIKVTFTPSGDISLDVTKGLATFGTPTAGTGNNSPTEGGSTAYTLYNNGSVAAHVYIWTNGSTNSSEWTLDSTGTPALDQYSLKRWNNTGGGSVYIRNTNTSFIASLAGAGATRIFGVTLALGNASASSKLDQQRTRINITGVKA